MDFYLLLFPSQTAPKIHEEFHREKQTPTPTTSRLGEGVKTRKFPKVVPRGCKRSFGRREAEVSQKSLAPSEACFALVQPYFAPVQDAFRSLGPKDLLLPLVPTFGNFLFLTPSPRHAKGNKRQSQPRQGGLATLWARLRGRN